MTSARLRALLGDYPGTAALKNGTVTSNSVALDFADYTPAHKGFKPMVREPLVVGGGPVE